MRMAIRVCRAIVPPFLLTLIQGLLGPGLAQEMLPDGGNVVAGAATISRIGNDALSIHQTSDRAIVDWHSFSVGAGQTVTFVQPGAGSAILNRVTSGTQSIIAGEILGNGQVFLVNPNGIFITASGAVSAQGFVASSLDIANADFMGADLRFHGNGASAKVANAGTITGESGGFAALLGGSVENSGTLIVPLGRIGLGAGESATLDHTGDGFLQVALPGGENGDDTAIAQSGTIAAEGGLVAIEAATARDAARNVVRLSGSVSAKTVSGRNGAIVFGAGGGGQLQVSARVDVSDADQGGGGEVRLSGATVQLEGAALDATSAGAQGGTVTILGDQISLGSTRIDVSGAQAGGTILIGGGPYGMGNFRRAQTVTVDSQTSLSADGQGVGSGGTVVLWSDFDTQFFGAISARAGAEGGDGGFAEVSSAGRLTYSGTADLRAGRGRAGDLLLDPYNITISSAADGGMAGFTANADDSNINTTTLQDALAMANVTVSTGGAGTQAGNITLLDALTWASGTQLTFDAANSITLSAPVNATGGGGLHLVAGNDITLNNAIGVGFGSGIGVLLHAGDTIIGNSGASITTQGQAVTLNSDRDGSGAGAIALTSTTITTNGGDITLGGSMDPATGAAWSSGADVSGVSLSGGSLAAAAGSISIAGRSNAAGYGIVLRDGASVSTSSGDIDLTGVGGTSGTYAIGVMMTTGGASVTSGDGDITVTGTGGTSTGQYAAGVRMHVDQSVIEATGSGSITITGVGGETAQNAHGVVVGSGPDSRVRTASGNLTIHGTARSADATFGTVIAQGGRAETGSGNLTITGIAPLGATAAIGSQTDSPILSMGGGDITLNGDTFQLAGSVSGTGNLVIQPTSPETTIGLGAGAVGDLHLNATELARLLDGFARITIGSATGTGALHVRTWAATDPLVIRSLSGDVNLNGAVSTGSGTSAGSITIATGGTLTGAAASSITTQNEAITLTGAPVSGAMALASNGAPITITQTGTGSISGILSGANSSLVKGGTGTLTLTAANSFTGGTTVTAGTLGIGAGGGGLIGGGNISIASGALLRFDTTAYHGGTQISGNLSGSGTVEVGGSSSNRIVRFSGDNSGFSGTFRLNTGARVALHSATSASAAAAFIIDGLLTPQATGATLQFGSLEGGGAITLGGGTSNTTLEIGGTGSSTTFAGNIGNVADSISLRKVGSGTLTLGGTYTYTGATTVNAGTLSLDGAWNRSGATVNVAVASGATLSGGGGITSNILSYSGGGTLNLTGNNSIASLATSGTIGTFTLNNTRALTMGAMAATGPITIITSGATSDLTLGQPITTTSAGDAITLVAGRNVVNNAGATALTTGMGGRFLVYSTDWAADTVGGLVAGRLYNRSYASNPPATITQPGSQFIYARQPVVTVQTVDATRSYGEVNPAFTATISGLVNGDTAAQAFVGAPSFGTAATAASGIGAYVVTPGMGSLTATALGYGFNFVDGRLDVVPRAITVTADDQLRFLGRPNPALTYRITGLGLANGDVLSGGLATVADATSAVGSYAITRGTLAASGNYDLAFLDGNLTVFGDVGDSRPDAGRFVAAVSSEGAFAADSLQLGLEPLDTTCLGSPKFDALHIRCALVEN